MFYAQIGGLAVATFITLLLVPISIFVLDLKWIQWEITGDRERPAQAEPTTRRPERTGFLQENNLDLRPTEKIALVTGSMAGIRVAIAKSLGSEGAHVHVNGRTPAAIDTSPDLRKPRRLWLPTAQAVHRSIRFLDRMLRGVGE